MNIYDDADLQWLLERPLQPPTILNHWDGTPSMLLFKISSGAMLWWMFDEDDDDQLGLFAHLSDGEAQAVFEGTISDGLLEPIRKTMKYPQAVVWAIKKQKVYAARFTIPAELEEPEFANLVWEAAENTVADASSHALSDRVATTQHNLRLPAG